MKVWRSILLAGALLFIAKATLTRGAALSSGALRTDFWCFACGPYGSADLTLNFALFIPLGVALSLLGLSPLRALFVGVVLSVSVESAQRLGWAPGRVASATDLLTNSTGAYVGALVAWYRAKWLGPARPMARLLAGIGTVIAIAFLSFTAWALGPDIGANASPERVPALRPSPFPYTPGYGWYHGRVSEVMIDGMSYRHSGDGPVMLRGAVNGSLQGSVTLSGRDERTDFIPFLYVHDLNVAVPKLMLGQEENDLRLIASLRGRRLRFPGPSLSLSNAFAKVADEPQTLSFSVTPAAWELSSNVGETTQRVVLPVSFSLGWTLLQTVVHVGDRGSVAITVGWLFALWLPIGFWCAMAGRAETVAGVAALILTLWFVPVVATIARCSPVDWLSAISGLLSGVFFGISKRNSSLQ